MRFDQRRAEDGVVVVMDRLGNGGPWRTNDTFPTLEEVVGDGWSSAILEAILPPDRAWAWWGPTATYKLTRLPGDSAPDVVDTGTLAGVVVRRLRLERMTLAFVPPGDLTSQRTVTAWAGADPEQAAEHIWTAADDRPWSTDAIVGWCRDPGQWSDAATVPHQPAERIATMFDQQIFLALVSDAAASAIAALRNLAARWRLSIIGGPNGYAWPVRPRR